MLAVKVEQRPLPVQAQPQTMAKVDLVGVQGAHDLRQNEDE